jgi:hypothetical protein
MVNTTVMAMKFAKKEIAQIPAVKYFGDAGDQPFILLAITGSYWCGSRFFFHQTPINLNIGGFL